jgi:hypothetical protein
MYKYLQAWESAIPTVQGSQIVQLLTDMRDQGIIKTEQDYRTALNRLTGAINATDPVPLSKLFPALLDVIIDSESFNWMVDRLTSDLVSGFREAQNIEDLLKAHRKVYEEFTIAKLKQIIGIVEQQVVFHELLRQNVEGFSNMQYNTFTQNAKSTSRSSVLATQLFYDRSSREAIESRFDAVVDAVNEALELPGTVNTRIFTKAEIDLENTTDDVITDEEKDVVYTYFGTGLAATNNLIDGVEDTYYIKPFFMDDTVASGAQLRLKLECGGLRPINYIEMYPVSDYPFQITSIQYLHKDGVVYSVEMQESGLLGVDIYRPTRFHFKEVEAREIYVTATQFHYTLINFQDSSVKEVPSENFQGTYLETQVVQDIINDAYENDAFLDFLREQFDAVDKPYRMYQYVIGFDNIWTGRISYEDTGIFAGETFSINRCRRIGLVTDEATTTYTLENQRDSIEYWVYKQDYNDVGGLIGISAAPIMPEGVSEVYERLHLTEVSSGLKANTGTLRFQGHWGAPDPTTVSVYQNGLPLEQDVDWTFTDSGNLSLLNYTRITITTPVGGEVYTVRYTPVQYLPGADTTRHYRQNQPYLYYFGESNVIRTAGEIGSEDVAESDIYLIIIIRHNHNIDFTQSPRINEYSLMVASEDPNRLYE